MKDGEAIEEEGDNEEDQPLAVVGLLILCASLDRFVDQQREGDAHTE